MPFTAAWPLWSGGGRAGVGGNDCQGSPAGAAESAERDIEHMISHKIQIAARPRKRSEGGIGSSRRMAMPSTLWRWGIDRQLGIKSTTVGGPRLAPGNVSCESRE